MAPKEIQFPNVCDQDIVFDLDGTLINGDIGETTFLHLKSEGQLGHDSPPLILQISNDIPGDPESHAIHKYLRYCESNQFDRAYLYTADEIAKYEASVIYKAVANFLEESSGFSQIKIQFTDENQKSPLVEYTVNYGISIRKKLTGLISQFQKMKAKIWIVSASPQFVVDACGEEFGLLQENVYGAVPGNGLYSKGRFPWKSDKVQVLYDAGVREPLIVFGNGIEDLEMLKTARYPVVMEDGHPGLLEHAREQDWTIYSDETTIHIDENINIGED